MKDRGLLIKNRRLLLTICLIGSLLIPGWSNGGTAKAERYFAKNVKHIDSKMDQRLKRPITIPEIKRKPDLAMVGIQAVRWQQGFCYLKITVKNTGKVPLPQDMYRYPDPGVSVTVNDHPAGSMKLKQFDPGKKLRKPGGTVTKNWGFTPDRLLTAGQSYTVKANVFTYPIAEENFHNNILVRQVRCK